MLPALHYSVGSPKLTSPASARFPQTTSGTKSTRVLSDKLWNERNLSPMKKGASKIANVWAKVNVTRSLTSRICGKPLCSAPRPYSYVSIAFVCRRMAALLPRTKEFGRNQ